MTTTYVVKELATGMYYSEPNTPGQMFSASIMDAFPMSYWDALECSDAIKVQSQENADDIYTAVVRYE